MAPSLDFYLENIEAILTRLQGESGARVAIIDPEGVLRYAGAIDSKNSSSVKDIPAATNYVRAALDSGLAGRPIASVSDRPRSLASWRIARSIASCLMLMPIVFL